MVLHILNSSGPVLLRSDLIHWPDQKIGIFHGLVFGGHWLKEIFQGFPVSWDLKQKKDRSQISRN
jgi:hypothetical protein